MRCISLNILIFLLFFFHLAYKENFFEIYRIMALVASAGIFPFPINFHFFLCQIFPEILFSSNFQIFRSSSFYKQHVQLGRIEAALLDSLFSTFHLFFIISQQHSKGGNSTLLNYTKFKYTLSGRGVLYVPGPT